MRRRELIKKVCLVGDSGVGKKTIAGLVAPFEKGIDKYTDKIGLAVTKYGLEFQFATQSIRLIIMIWDVTGQQEYRRLQRSYCLGAEGVIVVADASLPSSLESLRGWIKAIRGVSGDIPAVVIVNRTSGLPEAAKAGLQRSLTAVLAPFNAPFFLVDAASSGVAALKAPFHELAKRIASRAAATPSPGEPGPSRGQ